MNAWKIAILVAAVCTGCASPYSARCRSEGVGLSLEEAREVVTSFEKAQAVKADANPLKDPKSLGDVLEILRLDQVDLFPAAIRYTAKLDTIEALVLRAQIELAWGEAQLVLSDASANLSRQMRDELKEARTRAAAGVRDEMNQSIIDTLGPYVEKTTRNSDALMRLAAEHVADGAKLAREVIKRAPTDYHGYRLEADYYRLRGDWTAFDGMMAKLRELNPESNGLTFLQGVEAGSRLGDKARALAYFKKALEKDPKFVRAQVQIYNLMSEKKISPVEFENLKKMNPNHQIVLWIGQFMQEEELFRVITK
ncbi:MAG: hypothetical protein WC889_15795 [Myxococcota bacterium]|jgi:tetratricopeptide (TPR) repeat protein